MYITINDVIGKKTINLTYPIYLRPAEIAVISVFSDNVQYEITKETTVSFGEVEVKKLPKGFYWGREIIEVLRWEIEPGTLEEDRKVKKINKLSGITEMNLSLDELDNMENLKDGKPSNSLLNYYVTNSANFTNLEPHTPQYKRLKSGRIVSLTLRITDQNDNIMTNRTSVVLHVR